METHSGNKRYFHDANQKVEFNRQYL